MPGNVWKISTAKGNQRQLVRFNSKEKINATFSFSQGVSNYEIHHIEELALTSTISPHVNQIYYNPLVVDNQFDLVSYCDNHKIHVMLTHIVFMISYV